MRIFEWITKLIDKINITKKCPTSNKAYSAGLMSLAAIKGLVIDMLS